MRNFLIPSFFIPQYGVRKHLCHNCLYENDDSCKSPSVGTNFCHWWL